MPQSSQDSPEGLHAKLLLENATGKARHAGCSVIRWYGLICVAIYVDARLDAMNSSAGLFMGGKNFISLVWLEGM